MRLKIGSKFSWKTQKHHVLGFVEDRGQQMIVAKYWRGSSWGNCMSLVVLGQSGMDGHQPLICAVLKRHDPGDGHVVDGQLEDDRVRSRIARFVEPDLADRPPAPGELFRKWAARLDHAHSLRPEFSQAATGRRGR